MKQNNNFPTIFDTDAVIKYAELGKSNMNWYSDTFQAFTDLLPEYDIDLFVKIFAITSPLSHPQSHIITALRTYRGYTTGQPITEMRLLPNIKVMLRSLQAGTFNPSAARNVSRRKVLKFCSAIMGDKQAVPVDSWMCRVLGTGKTYEWKGKSYYRLPTLKQTNEIEAFIQTLAVKHHYEPRQLMASIWAGVREEEGKFKKTNMHDLVSEALLKI